MKTIFRNEVVDFALNVKSEIDDGGSKAKILTITLRTQPKVRKTGNPFDCIEVVKKVQIMFNAIYEKRVQKVTGDNTFHASAPSWGVNRSRGLRFHNGQNYLCYIPKKVLSEEWFADKHRVDKSVIQEFLIEDTSKSAVPYRTVKIENILSLNYNGETYNILD